MYQISSPSDNLCTRYLLPNLVDFVESVIDRPTKNSKRHVSAYHAATTTVSQVTNHITVIVTSHSTDLCYRCMLMVVLWNTADHPVVSIYLSVCLSVCLSIYLSIYLSQLRRISTIGKKLVKQQYLLHMSPQYGELRPTSG